MDLAIGAKDVFVMMTLFTKDGAPKLVKECSSLTGRRCVSRVYTELAIFQITARGVVVTESFGTTFDDLARRLDVPLLLASRLHRSE
jgi:3-oxoadipate CoA-transferase beta subunit